MSVHFGPWTTLYPTHKRHMKLAVRPSALKHRSSRPCDYVRFAFSETQAAALFMHQTRSSWRNITAHFRSQTRFISHCLCLCIIIMCVRFCMEKNLRCQHVHLQEGLVWLPLLCCSGVKTHVSSFGHAAVLCRFVLYKLAGWVWWPRSAEERIT